MATLKDFETIRSTRPTDEYRTNWEKIFGAKKIEPKPLCSYCQGRMVPGCICDQREQT